jgi:transcriptional regulator with XRE-family HTH domain
MPSDQPAWVLQIRRQVGRRIRDLREGRQLSQLELAGLAGIGRHTMYRAELGTHAASIDAIVKIAAALDVPPDRLFRDE